MIDSNLRQLLDELYAREGIPALNRYADRDEISKQAVEEYKIELAEQEASLWISNNQEVISSNLKSSNNGAPNGSFTGRCKKCKQFWFPASMCDKCPDCASANDEQHTDYFVGQVESFQPIEVTKSNTPNLDQSFIGKAKDFLDKHRHPFA